MILALSIKLVKEVFVLSTSFILYWSVLVTEDAKATCQGTGSSHQLKKKDVMKIMEIKYLSSLAEPGEPVGVIAGQSIGEPSMQMTLNTFHLAGLGERNVTLGIPRLQEILRNAKENIQTPIMKFPLLDWKTREDAEELATKFRRICVADIVESMEVSTVPFSIHKDQVSTIYKLTLKLYPLDVYPPHSDITLEARNEILEETFLFAMEDAITKHLETLSKINDINVVSLNEENSLVEEKDEDEAKTKSSGGDDNDGGGGGDDDDNDNFEDQGADAEKRKRQISDEMEYEDGDEKETSAMVNEYEEEPPSGFEREIDQVEADDDFAIGEGFDDTETDEDEAPGSPSADESKAAVTTSKQDMKSRGKQTGLPKRNKKKIKTVIYKKAGVSTFEAHFIFKKKPHILLAEIAQKTAKDVYLKEYKNIK